MIFQWICGGESGFPILFLCHLRIALHVQLFAIPWTQSGRLLCPWDFQGKNTEMGWISFSRWSSWPRDPSHVFFLAGRFFTIEPPGKPLLLLNSYYCYPKDTQREWGEASIINCVTQRVTGKVGCWVGLDTLGSSASAQIGLRGPSELLAVSAPGRVGLRIWEPEPHSFLHQVEMKIKSPSIPSATAHSTNMCPFENSPRKERSGGDYANITSSAGEPNFNKYTYSSLMCLTNQRRYLLYKSPSDNQVSEFI